MIAFICATYNEESTIEELLKGVVRWADIIRVCDDGSTDRTVEVLQHWKSRIPYRFDYQVIEHTGLPETVKAKALEMVPDNSWVALLDCDERFPKETIVNIMDFINNAPSDVTHVYFNMREYIDKHHTRSFLKCRLFKKEAAHFSTTIHEDERFDGNGYSPGWAVIHDKTSEKQVKREIEYLATYTQLLAQGKITQDRFNWLTSLHYFVKPHG